MRSELQACVYVELLLVLLLIDGDPDGHRGCNLMRNREDHLVERLNEEVYVWSAIAVWITSGRVILAILSWANHEWNDEPVETSFGIAAELK